jgi:ABC-type phosphate transport system substrate-binding protein
LLLKVTGTGTGFKEMIAGRIDIANASRAIKDSEKADCQKNNALSFWNYWWPWTGSRSASIKRTPGSIRSPLLSSRRSGNQAAPSRAGKMSMPHGLMFPIVLFGAGEESGTFDYFTEAINGKEDEITENYSPSSDDNVTITGVSGDKGGMGFFGCAYYFSQTRIKSKL